MPNRIWKRVLLSVFALAITVGFLLSTAAAITPWAKNRGKYYSANDDGSSPKVAPDVTCRGIDLSYHNGEVNFEKLSKLYQKGDISFVILRLGYGGDHENQDDAKWETYANACTRYGIPFGAYLYSYATSFDNAKSEAAHALRQIKNFTLTYPVYLDLEDDRQKDLGAEMLTGIVDIFCGTMLENGYETGVASPYYWFLDKNQLGSMDFETKHYSKWAARYSNQLNAENQALKCDLWQCSQNASIEGVPTKNCDVDFSYIEERTTDHCYVTFQTGNTEVTMPSPVHLSKGEKLGTLPSLQNEKGVRFTGWFTSPNGGEQVTENTVIPSSGKLTLYAHWPVEVTFSPENCTLSADSTQTVDIGKELTEITVTADSGYYLPESVSTLPDSLSFERMDYETAVIRGTVTEDCSVTLSAIPKEAQPAPDESLFAGTPASYQQSDATLSGFTSLMEIKENDNSGWRTLLRPELLYGLSELSPGEIEVRYAETGTKLAGESLLIVISEAEPTREQLLTAPPEVALFLIVFTSVLVPILLTSWIFHRNKQSKKRL